MNVPAAVRVAAVALPIAPSFAVPLRPVAGNANVAPRRTLSAGNSRPKFGVTAPSASRAWTCARNAAPDATKPAPVAVDAAGFATNAVVVTALTTRSLGRMTTVPVLPRMPVGNSALPVVSSFIASAMLPTSLYFAVTDAWPLVKVTACAADAPSVVATVEPFTVALTVPVAGFT